MAVLRALLFTVVSASAGAAACDDAGPRVYTAMAYRAADGCLDPYAPLGLVQAADLASSCEPVCLSGGDQLYVSSVCAPYPATTTAVSPSTSRECRDALAALDAGRACGDLEAGGDP